MPRTLFFALCMAAALSGQDSTTFRVDTRLVEVDVVVHRNRVPVEGLKADDFTLFDRGKKQRIAIFSVRRDSEAKAPRPLPAGVVTNRVAPLADGGVTATPTVILLDTLNSKPNDMAEVRRQLLQYLDRAPKNELFALYSLNKTLNRLHDFTGDRDHLRD
ncbi:MAG: VWA domain-containing protein, partial [Acidobacteriota bacterium]